ncbi:hypothetical protein Hanom_Chr14g01286341 [Helianthus anomalus]
MLLTLLLNGSENLGIEVAGGGGKEEKNYVAIMPTVCGLAPWNIRLEVLG